MNELTRRRSRQPGCNLPASPRRRMTAWNYTARPPDGSEQVVTFYSAAQAEAAKLARAWAAKAGVELDLAGSIEEGRA